MKNICDDCDWVISEYHYTREAIYYGFTVSGGSGSFQMNISAVIAIDSKGNIVMQIASGPAGTTTPAPPNLTISFVGGDTNAEHVSNLEGPGSSLGMGGPLPPIYGVPFGFATDEIYGLDEDGNVLWKGTSLVTSVGTPKLLKHMVRIHELKQYYIYIEKRAR